MDLFPGSFISIEGGEGSGKSTLILKLKSQLESEGYSVITTREPGGTAFGESVRQLLLEQKKEVNVGALAELFLFLASRSQQVQEVIAPALEKGWVVLCDRFNDSTIAYQGVARGLGKDLVQKQCFLACQGVLPDLTLFLDIDPKIGLKRRDEVLEKSEKDRIENEGFHFHEKVRLALLELGKEEPERIHVIDANLSKDEVFNLSLTIIHQLLKRHTRVE